jgi:hypothetical protein
MATGGPTLTPTRTSVAKKCAASRLTRSSKTKVPLGLSGADTQRAGELSAGVRPVNATEIRDDSSGAATRPVIVPREPPSKHELATPSPAERIADADRLVLREQISAERSAQREEPECMREDS